MDQDVARPCRTAQVPESILEDDPASIFERIVILRGTLSYGMPFFVSENVHYVVYAGYM